MKSDSENICRISFGICIWYILCSVLNFYSGMNSDISKVDKYLDYMSTSFNNIYKNPIRTYNKEQVSLINNIFILKTQNFDQKKYMLI